MYYKVDNRIYNPEEIKGKTFHQGNKPEPLFTLDEMKTAFSQGFIFADDCEFAIAQYFNQQFNITI